jgi:uncharacterized membrane protein
MMMRGNADFMKKVLVPVLIALALTVSLAAQASAQTCVGQTVVKSLSIANTGTEDDTYSIASSNPDWVQVDDSITIEAGQTVSVDVAVTPQLVGTNTYTITIFGSKDTPKTITASETAVECRDVTIIGAPSEITACQGIDAVFDVIIKNGGQITDTFDVSSSIGSIEQPRVTLEPDESRSMKLVVDTGELTDGMDIHISAASGNVVDTHSMSLVIRNCFSAQMTIGPKDLSQCPSDSVGYQIFLKNTGELEDEYLLTIMDEVTQTVKLDPEESRFFNFTLPLETGQGSMDIAVTAESDHVSLRDSATLTIRPAEECYTVRLDSSTVNVEQCSAKAVPISLRNVGSETQTFRLNIDGPEWVYLSTDKVSVEPGQEDEAYLYISPLFETDTDSYKITINSKSERSDSRIDLTVNVMPNATDFVPPTTTPDQPTDGTGDSEDEDNVTLNVSIGEEDDVTGAISLGVAPLWKTVVVAFITLIIVVILVVRFAILVKQ